MMKGMTRTIARRGGAFTSALLALASVGIAGCASHTTVPDTDRIRLERSLPGRTYYLRHAMYVGPFWSDESKLYLTDVVPDEITWVVNPAGVPIEPGPPTGVIPAGTRVRILRLELPTGRAVATRNPFVPRYNPWLQLEVEGLPARPIPTMVLRRDLGSALEIEEEIDRFLSRDDLEPMLAKLPPAMRRAVDEKRLIEGMSADVVAMAWGWPERREVAPSPEGRREVWTWPSNRRRAIIVGERLISWEGSAATPVADEL